MPRIYVTRAVPEAGIQRLTEAFGAESVCVWNHDRPNPRENLLKEVKGADAIFAILTERIDGEVMDAAGESLRIVANMAVGYDNIAVPDATQRGVLITNTPDVLTETTADLAWALLLSACRRVGEGERIVRANAWKGWGPLQLMGTDVYGKTLGIFGVGRIGQATARRASGFNMRMLYTARNRLSTEIESALNAEFADKDRLLAESDIISIHCPLTDETRHAFGAAEFARMREGAVLINTARGPVVDEAALAAALKAGRLRAAGIDVYEREPEIHPDLMACENAVLAPHLGSATEATRARMATTAADNIIAMLRGERPPNPVNPEVLE